MRTLTEILKEANICLTVTNLNILSNELYDNRNHYKEYEVVYGLEYMIEKAEILINEMKLNRLLNK